MAGHSKWKQIKHKKAATDAKKGQLFSKLVREIMVAAKAGAPDPETNMTLRTTIERARSQGLPKDNIERAIEKAKGTGEGVNLQEFLLEATALGGISILIAGITDNKNRSLAELKHIISEHEARTADPGSLLWNFEKIGTLTIPSEKISFTPDELGLIFIDAGAKDFYLTEDNWNIETEFADREKIRHKLESQGIPVSESSMDYKPKNHIQISEEEVLRLEPLLESLSDHDDVQEVYTNLQ